MITDIRSPLYWTLAWPGPWFTPVGTERSPSFTVLLVGILAYGGNLIFGTMLMLTLYAREEIFSRDRKG